MANEDGEYRALSGWRKIIRTFGVIGLIISCLTIIYGSMGSAIEVFLSSMALMLIASVLEWMGEVEHHLHRIAGDAARSVDRQNAIIKQLELTESDRHVEAEARTAEQRSGNPIKDFIDGK